ncbi:MAG: PEP-CTERM sorting domain-containing protein [Fimbriimonadales bacterium]
MRASRFIGVLCACVLAAAAQAQVVYSNVIATVAFTPKGFEEIEWTTQGSMNEIIDFLTGQVPVIVGDSTEHTTATVNIIYEAHSSFAIGQIGMVIQGSVFDWGRITWTELVEDMNNSNEVIGTAEGQFLGAAYKGGENGPINFHDILTLDTASTDIKVKKAFILDIADQGLPSTSLAALSLVEQNLIPEPSSILALAAPLALLAVRRRRR